MFFNGLQHIGIPTRRFAESRKFYEALGFELVNTEDNDGSKVGFYQLGTLMLESWESPKTVALIELRPSFFKMMVFS